MKLKGVREQLQGSGVLIMFELLPHSPIVTSIYIAHLHKSELGVFFFKYTGSQGLHLRGELRSFGFSSSETLTWTRFTSRRGSAKGLFGAARGSKSQISRKHKFVAADLSF